MAYVAAETQSKVIFYIVKKKLVWCWCDIFYFKGGIEGHWFRCIWLSMSGRSLRCSSRDAMRTVLHLRFRWHPNSLVPLQRRPLVWSRLQRYIVSCVVTLYAMMRAERYFLSNDVGCNFKELTDCGDRLSPFTCPYPDGKFPIKEGACSSQYYVCTNYATTLEVWYLHALRRYEMTVKSHRLRYVLSYRLAQAEESSTLLHRHASQLVVQVSCLFTFCLVLFVCFFNGKKNPNAYSDNDT